MKHIFFSVIAGCLAFVYTFFAESSIDLILSITLISLFGIYNYYNGLEQGRSEKIAKEDFENAQKEIEEEDSPEDENLNEMEIEDYEEEKE